MSKTNKIILVLVVIFVICGCASVFIFGFTRSRVSSIGGKYVNRKFGFEIMPPSNWKIKEITDNYIVLYGPREKDVNTILSISIKDNVTEDLDSYVNSKKSRLINDPEYKKFGSLRKIKVGDIQGYELTYTNIAKKESASGSWYEPFNKHKEVFFMKDNKRFQITYVVAYSEYETYLPIIDESIRSFKFIEVP